MPSFNRIVLLVVLYLTLLTSAAPVTEDEVSSLEARKVTARPKPAPRPKPIPKPKPTPKPTVVKRPPVKTPIRLPPKKTPVPAPRPTTPVHVPVPPHGNTTASHGSHTTSAHAPVPTTGVHGAACPLPPKKPSKPREILDYVSSFFVEKRSHEEFIGWHGTNSATWAVWERAGYLRKPWSWMDIIGQRRTGGSGADQELGAGVYVTDELRTAEGFAVTNAVQPHNAGTFAVLCAIFARDTTEWRTTIPKVWLPNNLIGDSSNAIRHNQYEAYRGQWIQRVVPQFHPADVVRFAPLDRSRGHPPSQMVIPSSQTGKVFARCVRAGGGVVPAGAPAGNHNYAGSLHTWNILTQPCR